MVGRLFLVHAGCAFSLTKQSQQRLYDSSSSTLRYVWTTLCARHGLINRDTSTFTTNTTSKTSPPLTHRRMRSARHGRRAAAAVVVLLYLVVLLLLVSSSCAFIPCSVLTTTTTSTARTRTSTTSRRPMRAASVVYEAKAGSPLLEAMSQAVGQALYKDASACILEPTTGGGSAGGGGASTGAAKDPKTGAKYFYKSTGHWGLKMLLAEYKGIKAMYDTQTIRTPTPVAVGTSDNQAFVVFEYLSMGGARGEAAARMGKELAQMHRHTSKNGKFGWEIDNTIGATPQPNGWRDSWVEFWDEQRLGHMLRLCRREGCDFGGVEGELRTKVRAILTDGGYAPQPSLLHGDLWTGNAGVTDDEAPCIFDPATYYGDRETDLAMTTLFGSLAPDFYKAYMEEWPLEEGHEKRKVVYNLYHILSHIVLFGGGYRSQAQRMIDQIMKM